MKKLERPKASKREHGVDFISNMPDSILVLILSRLRSTEEVIRTSILSKRWKCLWTSVPSINMRYKGNLTVDEFKEFVYWVLVNKSVDLDSFRLSCSSHYTMLTVGRWIHAAVAKNLKQLELRFCPTADFKMPHCLVNCRSLEVLRINLKGRGLRFPKIIGFPALRVLDLTYVNFLDDGKLVKEYLESCPLLEDLTLLNCLMKNLKLLRISCPNLKKLSICNPKDVGMWRGICGGIKISCPKLVNLEIRGCIANYYYFGSLDSLKEAVIEPYMIDNTMFGMFPGFYHVESLFIDFCDFYECFSAASDPSLPYLKTLMLTTTGYGLKFDKFVQILECYPDLESLKLIVTQKIYGPGIWERLGGDARRFLACGDEELKGVEFLEYNGEKPKVVMDWSAITSLEMEFSWGR